MESQSQRTSRTASMSSTASFQSTPKSFTEHRYRQRADTTAKSPPALHLAPLNRLALPVLATPGTAALSPLLMSSINAFPEPPAVSFAPLSNHRPLKPKESSNHLETPKMERRRTSSLPGALPDFSFFSSDDEQEEAPEAPIGKRGRARSSVRDSRSTAASSDVFFEASEELNQDILRDLARQSLTLSTCERLELSTFLNSTKRALQIYRDNTHSETRIAPAQTIRSSPGLPTSLRHRLQSDSVIPFCLLPRIKMTGGNPRQFL